MQSQTLGSGSEKGESKDSVFHLAQILAIHSKTGKGVQESQVFLCRGKRKPRKEALRPAQKVQGLRPLPGNIKKKKPQSSEYCQKRKVSRGVIERKMYDKKYWPIFNRGYGDTK